MQWPKLLFPNLFPVISLVYAAGQSVYLTWQNGVCSFFRSVIRCNSRLLWFLLLPTDMGRTLMLMAFHIGLKACDVEIFVMQSWFIPPSNCRYGMSLFQRFQKAGYPVLMLKEQYRMHPQVWSNYLQKQLCECVSQLKATVGTRNWVFWTLCAS